MAHVSSTKRSGGADAGAPALALVALVLALAVVLAFRDVALAGRTLQTTNLAHATLPSGSWGYVGPSPGHAPVIDPGCSAWQTEPWARLAGRLWGEGEVPLWNPHAGLGCPFAGNMLTGVFSFLRWPVFASGEPWVWDATLLARLFVAGLGALLFARARGLSLRAAALVGIAFELSGYLVFYVNMPQQDVDVLVPWVLLAFDRLAERRDARATVVASLAVALAVLGGMPESTFFAFVLGGLYFAHRSLVAALEGAGPGRAGLARVVRDLARFAAAVLAGHLLASLQLLPFLEFLGRAVTEHGGTRGLETLPPVTAITLVAPYFFADLGYFHMGFATLLGTVPLLLALVAAVASRRRDRLAGFFAGYALVSLLAIYGTPGTGWIGRLPAFDRCILPKYAMAEVSFAVAFLAGLGLDALGSRAARASHALGAAALLAVGLAGLALANRAGLEAAGRWERAVPHALEAAAFLAAATLAAVASQRPGTRRGGLAALVLVALGELLAYAPRERPLRADPFRVPPFVEALQREDRERGPVRVLALDKLLYPETSSAYGVDELRLLDALLLDRTVALERRLVADLANDRLGATESAAIRAHARALDLLAVTHVVAGRDLLEDSRVEEVLAQGRVHGRAGLATRATGTPEPVLVLVPPGEVVAVLDVPASDPVLRFSLQVPRSAGERPVAFSIRPLSPDGRPLAPFARTAVAGDAREEALDLGELAGRSVELHFLTRAAVDAPVAAGFVGLRMRRELPGLSVAYVGSDARVYRNETALPHARLVHRARVVADGPAALEAVADPGYTGRDEVVLERGGLERGGREGVVLDGAAPVASSARAGSPLRVVREGGRRVVVSGEAAEPGWVVLQDAWYPGWRATVDGEPREVLRADYAFRAVAVGAGPHSVVFEYAPASFRVGLALAGLAAVALALVWWRAPRSPPSVPA